MLIVDLLASHALAFILCVVLIGLLVGSFLNVVVYRLPLMLQRDWQSQAREVLEQPAAPTTETFNLILPNSSCPNCGHEIRPWENIPVISYLFLPVSGAFFMVSWLPQRFQHAVLWVPTVSCTELLREGWLGTSIHAMYDIPYVMVFNLVIMLPGLLLIRYISEHGVD